jgi:hypothetical protein
MAGFIRYFSAFPSVAEITEISGAFIVDVPPPTTPPVPGFGKVIMIGEFADMSFATDVDDSGNVTTRLQPVEILSSQDLIDKVGAFDPSLGDFGGASGNGFVALRNKRFNGGLVAVPLNLASSKGVRLVRELPTNKSVTDPSPVVPMQQAFVLAGSEFVLGANRVHLAKSQGFTDDSAYVVSTSGETTAVVAGANFDFEDTTATFVTDGVAVGDILVLGKVGAAGANGLNAGTYRIISIIDETALTAEAMDGSSLDIAASAGAELVYRIHPAATADSGAGKDYSDVGGYLLPARPLDATIAESSSLLPVIPADPANATSTDWDAFSGLQMLIMPGSGNDLVFTSAIQSANPVNGPELDQLYVDAIEATMTDDLPIGGSSFILCARTSLTIRQTLAQHVRIALADGMLRITAISPELTTTSLATVLGSSDPGVGANRSDRVVYNWPGARILIPEAVGVSIKGADGVSRTDGILDVTTDAFAISVMSGLPQERDPGQSAEPVPTILSPILGLQRNAPKLGLSEHKQLKKAGVMALRMTLDVGPVFQEGITSSLVDGTQDVNRRRFADFIEQSLASIYNLYAKQPLNDNLKNDIFSQTDAFLSQLKSANNPALARLNDYQIDKINGNTPDRERQGIYVIIVKVQMFPIAKFIGIQAEVGPNVVIQTSL